MVNVANKAAAAFNCTGAHNFCCCQFNGATFTCACTFGFSIATVVEIKGKGKIEQFAVVFSSFCFTTALPFSETCKSRHDLPLEIPA